MRYIFLIFILFTLHVNVPDVQCKRLRREYSELDESSENPTFQLNDEIKKDIETFVNTQTITEALNSLFQKQDIETYNALDRKNFLKCFQCKVAVYAILSYFRQGYPTKQFTDFVVGMCTSFLYDEHTCKGLAELNMPTFLYILEKRPNITAKEICHRTMQSVCINEVKYDDWQIDLHTDVVPPKQSPTINRNTNVESFKIIHISDIHYDFEYLTGSNSECNQPLCCRRYQGQGSTPETAAGYWGQYGSCDGPFRTLENTLENLKKHISEKNTIIYYTGDTVSHNVWNTTYKQIKDSLIILRKIMDKYLANYRIYPILGNHDTQPLNQFAPPQADDSPFNSTWLYEFLQDNWQGWLPNDALNNLKQGGYYSVQAAPNFRVIGLNSNICYSFNWWLWFDTDYLRKQLQWLSDELLKAEQNGEFVHILSHIPPGVSSCDITWEREFSRIVSRYSHIIKGMFNGHTHNDEFTLMFEDDQITKPVGMAFNTGGITTWQNVNPNFRIMHVDANTYDILDYEQWVYNLTHANKNFQQALPEWYKLYSFKDAYNVTSLSLSNLKDIVYNMAKNNEQFNMYRRFKGKNSDAFITMNCSNKCKESDLCQMVTSDYKNTKPCRTMINMWKKCGKN